MCKFGFCKVFGDGASHIFFKATADIRLRVMKFFQNFGNSIGKVIRILQKTCKTLDPGRSGVLQLRVLRKEEKKDIGDNAFIQKILKSSIFFRDRIESIELMFKKFNYFGSQSNFERGAGIYNRIIVRGGQEIAYIIKTLCFDADISVDVRFCSAGRKVMKVMGAKQIEGKRFQNFFFAVDIMRITWPETT